MQLHCDVEKSPHCLTAVTPFGKVGGEEGLTEASGSATTRRKIFPNYSPPLQKGAAAIGGGGIFLHRGEAAPSVSHWRTLVFAKKPKHSQETL